MGARELARFRCVTREEETLPAGLENTVAMWANVARITIIGANKLDANDHNQNHRASKRKPLPGQYAINERANFHRINNKSLDDHTAFGSVQPGVFGISSIHDGTHVVITSFW